MTTDNHQEKTDQPADDASRVQSKGDRGTSTGDSGAPQAAGGTAADADGDGNPPKRPGRALAALALLLALTALAGAGFLYYRLIYLSPTSDVATRVSSMELRLAALSDRIGILADRQAEDLAELEARQSAARAASEEALSTALSEVSRQGPPDPREWRLAEAQYLLRIANHRLLMERDVASALKLLRSADSILLELDDLALHPVRARLADEIAALERVEGVDVQGIFLRLEALKGSLDQLPLRLPEYLARDDAQAAPQGEFWSVVKSELQSYLQVRRFDGAVKPLLAPEEAVYLELNLRLMLERAQLAALRREQMIYEESLATALEWVDAYLDPEAKFVQQMRDELRALGEVSLDQPLPDISGSLNALLAQLRSPS